MKTLEIQILQATSGDKDAGKFRFYTPWCPSPELYGLLQGMRTMRNSNGATSGDEEAGNSYFTGHDARFQNFTGHFRG
jgi:hypothetical protein